MTHDGRRTTTRVWHKLTTGELKIKEHAGYLGLFSLFLYIHINNNVIIILQMSIVSFHSDCSFHLQNVQLHIKKNNVVVFNTPCHSLSLA